MAAQVREAAGLGAILALDFGRHMGWALRYSDRSIHHGVVEFDDRGSPGFDGIRIRAWLNATNMRAGGLAAVFYEAAKFQQSGWIAGHFYGGFEMTVATWCEAMRIPNEGVDTQRLKLRVTGRGDAPKTPRLMDERNKKAAKNKRAPYTGITVQEAVEALGYVVPDHNEQDAIALLYGAVADLLREDA